MNSDAPSEEYIPFGPEWESHMKRLPKAFLIEMIRKDGLEKQTTALTEKERKLTAFALFSAGMRIGPESFETVEEIVKKTGITEDFVDYAKDWIGYSEMKKS